MHEFIFLAWSCRCEAAEEIHQSSCHQGADPDVAIDNPYYITFCLPVCSVHVPDLRVWTQVRCKAIAS